ncbi:uncharacterized protein KY384_007762 [Bacidia gigantensis]|uniref:uncharacterized protein n=1 Tax=Bacidia gigantensis TaxID=2732470 RepID=UPI001D05992A|nr:uncharacterized protein KY384_007762 [Bacidia gigantensis]KAG8527609.1 hypothetical protein KY384_007762 [Bacidia gigantensis]
MSGLEGIVALSLASNVLQLVEFGAKLCARIREYSKATRGLDRLTHQADRLSALLEVLNGLDGGLFDGQCLRRCQDKAEEIEALLDSISGVGQGKLETVRKAWRSLRREEQLRELQASLDSLIGVLNLQLQAETRCEATKFLFIYVFLGLSQNQNSFTTYKQQHASDIDQSKRTNSSPGRPTHDDTAENADFVGRETFIAELEGRLALSETSRTAVLCGLGGVGKTQIALQYVWGYKETEVSIFWVHAGTESRFLESYKRIASECKIPRRNEPGVDLLQLVCDWLQFDYERQWLMVVDNVDNRSTFFEHLTSAGKSLREYLPQTSQGSYLVTTRSRDVALDISLHQDPIMIPSMDVEEALAMISPKIKSTSTREEQLHMISRLAYLPLAIVHATAFMIRRRKRISEYLTLYDASESMKIKLLGQRFSHGREARQLESIVTTWWISFNHIKSENPRAAELLSLMGFLDRQKIPYSLLMSDDEQNFDFEEALALLDSYSLVTLNSDLQSCNVHSLVCVAVNAWLSEFENKHEIFVRKALFTLQQRFPQGYFETWGVCGSYLPHVEKVLNLKVEHDDHETRFARAELLLNVSAYLRRQGQPLASEPKAKECMELFKMISGDNDRYTLASIGNFALTIQKNGRWEEALTLERQALDGRIKVLGYSDRETLESLNAVGSTLQNLGRHTEAAFLHNRELSEKQKLLDQDPEDVDLIKDVLIAINNVARVLHSLDQLEKAETMYRESLARSIDTIGLIHPDTFITRGELAATVRDAGKLREAEEMYKALLHDRMELLGEDHPDTLITLSNLGHLSNLRGDRAESTRLYKRSYELERRVHGDLHPSTINSRHNLACSLSEDERHPEAEDDFREILKLQNTIIGSSHPSTLQTRRNIATTLRKQNKYDEAYQLDVETLMIATELGEDAGKEKAAVFASLAYGFADQKQWAEAESWRRKEFEVRKAEFGLENRATMECLGYLAYTISSQSKNDEGALLWHQIYDYRRKTLGIGDESTLSALWNMALCHRDARNLEAAADWFQTLTNIRYEKDSANQQNILESLVQLSWVQQQLQRYVESEQNYRKSVEMYRQLHGADDSITLLATHNLASVLKYQDNTSEEAEIIARIAYEGRKKVLGLDDPATQNTLLLLTNHLVDMGKLAEADLLQKQTISQESNEDVNWRS